MAILKVYGSLLSTNAMRVLACLFEKELEFQLVLVNLATGENKEQTFLSINPFGQVPAFEDGNLKLFGSPRVEGDEDEEDVDDLEHEFNIEDEKNKEKYIMDALHHGKMSYGKSAFIKDSCVALLENRGGDLLGKLRFELYWLRG